MKRWGSRRKLKYESKENLWPPVNKPDTEMIEIRNDSDSSSSSNSSEDGIQFEDTIEDGLFYIFSTYKLNVNIKRN